MSISSFIRSDFSNKNISYLSDVNDRKLIPENDDILFFLCLSYFISPRAYKSRAGQQHGKIATRESVEVSFSSSLLPT
jgi:hypothetical protein